MANHFCALVLFECACCDMDHGSVTKYIKHNKNTMTHARP